MNLQQKVYLLFATLISILVMSVANAHLQKNCWVTMLYLALFHTVLILTYFSIGD